MTSPRVGSFRNSMASAMAAFSARIVGLLGGLHQPGDGLAAANLQRGVQSSLPDLRVAVGQFRKNDVDGGRVVLRRQFHQFGHPVFHISPLPRLRRTLCLAGVGVGRGTLVASTAPAITGSLRWRAWPPALPGWSRTTGRPAEPLPVCPLPCRKRSITPVRNPPNNSTAMTILGRICKYG